MKPFVRSLVLFVAETCVLACARSEPPGVRSGVEAAPRPVGSPAALSGTPSSTVAPLNASARSAAAAAPQAPGNPVDASLTPNADGPTAEDTLLDENGQPKPQTDDKPSADDPKLLARIALLCKAIVEGTPELAHDAFFPLVAYRQVKAIADPDRDYRLRLLRNFDRDVIEYNKRLTKRTRPIVCSGVKIPAAQARWMKPGSEYNRIGYYRVLRSQLALTDADGNSMTLEVTSFISWRGHWYVVHLNGFE